MTRLIYYIAIIATILLFGFCAPMLDLIGWSYTTAGGSPVTKIHPAFYLLLTGSVLAVAFGQRRAFALVATPRFLLYFVAAAILVGKAIMITLAGKNEGELSSTLDTFMTPAFVLICFYAVKPEDLSRIGAGLRLFFVFNSIMGIVERLIGSRFVPSFIDQYTSQDRASAMLGHPLNAALLTGVMIIFLVTSVRNTVPAPLKIGEIMLHALAMFAFGGRGALVFTVLVLLISSVSVGRAGQAERAGFAQRVIPFAIIAVGIVLVFLPIPFIDATLDRFTNDQGSAQTRDGALRAIMMLDLNQLAVGIDVSQRQVMMKFLNTPMGFEISWIALTLTYGFLATIPMLFALPVMLFGSAQNLDRSAFYIALLFMIVTVGSLAIGSKTLLLCQTLIMMLTLAQRTQVSRSLGLQVEGYERDRTPAPFFASGN